jgi:hypothetical protein
MSDDTNAVDGAITAAPVENEATEQVAVEEQETSAAPAEAEQGQEPERDEQGRFTGRKAQERINELTRARRQAERERDHYAAMLQQQQTAPAPQGNKPPAFEDFNDLNEWGRAIAETAAAQARQVAAQEFAQRQQQAQAAQVFSSYEAREREYAATNPGYQDAMAALQSTVRFSPEVLEVLGASDAGPAVVHYLGEHLDAADKLQRLPPHLAAAEIARIEARVKAPKAKPVSKTPSPAPVLAGGSVAQKDPEQMTTDEWLAWRRNQLKAK